MRLKKKTRKNNYIVVQIVSLRSQRFRGIQMYEINFVCRVIYAPVADLMHALRTCLFPRAADLFVYGHSLLQSHMPDDIV